MTAAIYSYLTVKHLILTSGNVTSTCLYNFVPCFLLYNSFSNQEALAYLCTLVTFLGLGIGACMQQLLA